MVEKVVDWIKGNINQFNKKSSHKSNETNAIDDCQQHIDDVEKSEEVEAQSIGKEVFLLPSRVFESEKIILELKECHKSWNKDHRQVFKWKLDCGKMFSTHNNFRKDMGFFCSIYTFRGTCWQRIVDSSQGDMKKILLHLTNKYQIAERPKEGEWYKADDITLERIARCYPDICCNLYAQSKSAWLVDHETVLGVNITGSKQAIFCPLFPSIASSSLLLGHANILPQLLWIAHMTDGTLTGHQKKLETLWFELMQAINVHLIPEMAKEVFCKRWKLLNKKGCQVMKLRESRIKCINFLEEVYGNDHDWPDIRSSMDLFCRFPNETWMYDRQFNVRDDLNKYINDYEWSQGLTDSSDEGF